MSSALIVSVTSQSAETFLFQDKNSKSDRDKGNNKLHKSGSGNIRSSEKSECSQSATDANSARARQPVKKVKAKATTSLPNLGSLELPYKPKTIDDRKDKRKQRAKGEQ